MNVENNTENKTIAAISTPAGVGAVSIVRMSGKKSLDILQKIFVKKTAGKLQTHKIYYGHISHAGKTIDEVLVTIMLAPKSYTTEDIVEINCHGGHISAKAVLFAVISNGAVIAQPGEFTKRAFLNGRIDLSQVEAVIDIINTTSAFAHNAAINMLGGSLSKKIQTMRQELLAKIATLEVAIDYPEEEYFTSTDDIKQTINNHIQQLDQIIKNAKVYELSKQGIKTVILGKPNVGKSSLLNTLLQQDRAIVTDIPGTTRDTISEHLLIGNIPITIIDTAGIHQTADKIEALGVERTHSAIEHADLLLAVIDISKPITTDDLSILDLATPKKHIVVCNKIDQGINEKTLSQIEKTTEKSQIIKISATTQAGLQDLKNAILAHYPQIDIAAEITAANARQQEVLYKAKQALSLAKKSINENQSEEFISLDMTTAYNTLGEALGENTNEDIINKIFENFCLGK